MVELVTFCIIAFMALKVFNWAVDVVTDFVAGSAKFIAWAFVGAIVWATLTGTELSGTVEMLIDNVKSMM